MDTYLWEVKRQQVLHALEAHRIVIDDQDACRVRRAPSASPLLMLLARIKKSRQLLAFRSLTRDYGERRPSVERGLPELTCCPFRFLSSAGLYHRYSSSGTVVK
jgi:hypothetical protein